MLSAPHPRFEQKTLLLASYYSYSKRTGTCQLDLLMFHSLITVIKLNTSTILRKISVAGSTWRDKAPWAPSIPTFKPPLSHMTAATPPCLPGPYLTGQKCCSYGWRLKGWRRSFRKSQKVRIPSFSIRNREDCTSSVNSACFGREHEMRWDEKERGGAGIRAFFFFLMATCLWDLSSPEWELNPGPWQWH